MCRGEKDEQAERIPVEAEERPPTPEADQQPTKPMATDGSAKCEDRAALAALSVRSLRERCVERGVSMDGAIDKEDLVKALLQDAKRRAIVAAVAAAREAAAREAAAREARMLEEAAALLEARLVSEGTRKACADDLLEASACKSSSGLPQGDSGKSDGAHVKDYRMQGNFGQTKFIKP